MRCRPTIFSTTDSSTGQCRQRPPLLPKREETKKSLILKKPFRSVVDKGRQLKRQPLFGAGEFMFSGALRVNLWVYIF